MISENHGDKVHFETSNIEEKLYCSGFKSWYTEKVRSRNGVGTVVDKERKKDILNVKRKEGWIISQKFIVEQDTFNVISVYAPQNTLK